tara:strand:+ start:5305 stop:7314 length:2010 start_codon:yes stop_codon:yes gene_type:complete
MMDKLHVGHIDDKNYALFGKLSDGTPVYRYSPPPPPDPNILREKKRKKGQVIDGYNKTTELNVTDTSQFLDTFNKQELKEQRKKQYAEYIKENKFEEEPVKDVDDKYNVLDYIQNKSDIEAPEEVSVSDNTTDYLDLFKAQEERAQLEEQQREKAKRQIKEASDAEEARRAASAQKYQDYLDSIKDDELQKVKKYEELIEKREQVLHEEYNNILVSHPLQEFYTESTEFDIDTDIQSRSVTVTNVGTGDQRFFNYVGSLQHVSITEYKLKMYSIVRGEKDYGILRESHEGNYITHRHTAFDLRTGESIIRETYVVSKYDPNLGYNEDSGWHTRSVTLSSKSHPSHYYDYPVVNDTLNIENFITANVDGVATKVIPTQIFLECFGAGGAGLSGVESAQGAAGGGGGYIRKTINISPFQQFPMRIRFNVGDGRWAGFQKAINNDTEWNNNIPIPEKDTYFIVENYTRMGATAVEVYPLTAGALGGRDGNLDPFYASAVATPGVNTGYPGKPILGPDPWNPDLETGYWGSGNKPWSVMQYELSGITNESTWGTYIYGVQNYGITCNGALSSTPGAGSNDSGMASTLNIGGSGGQTSRGSGSEATSGRFTGGGGGPGYDDEIVYKWVEDPPPGSGIYSQVFDHYETYTKGQSGSHGKFRVVVTKGIVNRYMYN